MKPIKVDWTTFKSNVDSRNLSVQYIEYTDYYDLFILEDSLVLNCLVHKDSGDDQTDFEDNYKDLGNKKHSQLNYPFGAKELNDKKIFKRVHGKSDTLTTGSNDLIFVVPYNWVKITGVEFVGSEIGDYASLYVLDSTTGTYSTVPDYQLNQFGFDVMLAKDIYSHKSEFDADLYLNMQIKIVYNSISDKDVGINFILNELK